MPPEERSGFTLVELLIVIATISVLAGLLLPALDRATEDARSILCLNNHKQVYLGTTMYCDDNDDKMPLYFVYGGAKAYYMGSSTRVLGEDPGWLGAARLWADGYIEAPEVLREPSYHMENVSGAGTPAQTDDQGWRFDELKGPPPVINFNYSYCYSAYAQYDTSGGSNPASGRLRPGRNGGFWSGTVLDYSVDAVSCFYLCDMFRIETGLGAHRFEALNATYVDGHARQLLIDPTLEAEWRNSTNLRTYGTRLVYCGEGINSWATWVDEQ